MINAPKIPSKFRADPPMRGFWGPVRLRSYRGFGPGGFNTKLSGAVFPGFNTGSGFSITALADLPGAYLFTDDDANATGGTVSSTAATIYAIAVDNSRNTSPVYVKLYGAAIGSVEVGTTDPAMTIPAMAGKTAEMAFPGGLAFATAVSEATVTDAGTAGDESPIMPVTVKVVYV